MPLPIGYQEAIETPKASRAMEALWSFRAACSGASVVLPDGRCDLILRAFEETPGKFIPVVTGPATSPYTVRYDAGDTWYGIRMRPERAVMVWGNQLEEARESVVRGVDAERLLPALGEQAGKRGPMERLKRAVPKSAGAKDLTRLSYAIDVIHSAGGRLRVEPLAHRVGCSSRHLNRLFCENVGLGIKSYIQLAQFHRTLRLICAEGLTLTQAAFEGGYADHAHMTRAFKRFGGFAPSAIPENLDLPKVFHAHV